MADPGQRKDGPSGGSSNADDAELSSAAQGMRAAQPWLAAVWKLLGGCIVGVGGGMWMDHAFGWTPWGTVGFSMLGISVGFYAFIKTALSLGKNKS